MRSRFILSLTPRRLSLVVTALGILLVIFFSVEKLRLGLGRYFDMDEFAYLNWAYHASIGNRPYLDFMLLVTPFYLVILAPLFWWWQGIEAVLAGRVLAFGIFVMMMGALVQLFWEARRSPLAVVVALILLILPMPADKFLEIRPDNLATTFLLLGLLFQQRFIRTNRPLTAFGAGIWYSLSLLTLQKLLPQVLLAAAVGLISRRGLFAFLAGLILPWGIFGGWALFTGNPQLVAYSIIKLPLESSVISRFNQVSPLFYFSPNNIYYGKFGYSLGLLVNQALWLVGLGVATGRLVSVFFSHPKNKSQELLPAVMLVTLVVSYFWWLPLKHPQYLIPAAALVAWYVADGVFLVWQLLKNHAASRFWFLAGFSLFAWLVYATFKSVHQPKLAWTNESQLQKMQEIYETIPSGEYILDLEGRTIYYPYPYPVCCLSFGQFGSSLSQPLPSLWQSLARTRTKYIYQAEIDRIGALIPEDREFIRVHYTPQMGGELWVARDW